MASSHDIVRKIIALGCGALALAGVIGFAGFVLLTGLDLLPRRESLPDPWPWLVNLGWLVVFALQHSGMARQGFKRAWTRIVPPALERCVYVALSGLALIGLTLTWQPLPGRPIWQLPTVVVLISLSGAVATIWVATRLFDLAQFLGWRQAADSEPDPEALRIYGPYRYVRHPLMLSVLVFIWGQPVMRPELFLLNSGLTLYILIAVRLEERDLRRQFGQAYADYRRQVPALVPWRVPAPRRQHTGTVGDKR
jgi:protein-S-isoprenylcysteine O-methyltransferase Ste14